MGQFAYTNYALQLKAQVQAALISDNAGWKVGLFVNNYFPIPGWTIGDLVEATVAGYARQTLSGSVWTLGIVDDEAIATSPDTVTFTATAGSELCYGYFVYDDPDGFEWSAQRFDVPQTLTPGVPIVFTLREKTKNC